MHIADGTVGGAVNEEGMTKNGEDIGTTRMDTLVPVTIDIEDGEVTFSFSSLRQLLSLARICGWPLLICQTPFLSGGCSSSVPILDVCGLRIRLLRASQTGFRTIQSSMQCNRLYSWEHEVHIT